MSEQKKSNLEGAKDRLEGAPDWYGTPLDQLDFEWSREEELEIERYCQKIHKNIADEEMTPRERFEATMAGKEKDRLWINSAFFNVYAVRALDSGADALKPIDVYQNPKLLVKAHLATVARFGLDSTGLHSISYADELWGGRARMIEYGNPCEVGDPPMKSVEDIDGLLKTIEIPDPKRDGLFPGYLWACREMKRIFIQYGLDKVMPVQANIAGSDPIGIVIMAMLGWSKFVKALRKEPELCRQCLELALEWGTNFGKAMHEMIGDGNPIDMCSAIGWLPPDGNEWLTEYWARQGKALASSGPVWYNYGDEQATEWLSLLYEKGALGLDSFRGGMAAYPTDYKVIIDFHREHDLYCAVSLPNGPMIRKEFAGIEETARKRCEYAKSHKRAAIAIMADYWAPLESFEAAVAAIKKHGKF